MFTPPLGDIDARLPAMAGSGLTLLAALAITRRRRRMFENKMMDDAKWAKVYAQENGVQTVAVADEEVGPDGLTFREREVLRDGVMIVDGKVVPPTLKGA